MSLTLLYVFLSGITYRIARFLILDVLIEEPRDKVYAFLARRPNLLTIKLQELIKCPYCLTIWVSAFVVLGVWIFHPLPLPLLWWLAVAAGSLVWWVIIDADD